LGSPDGVRDDRAARGEKLVVQRERREPEYFAHRVDLLTQGAQTIDDRRDLCARVAILLMVEQAPTAGGRLTQRVGQRLFIFRFQFGATVIETFEAVRFGHEAAWAAWGGPVNHAPPTHGTQFTCIALDSYISIWLCKAL
jgi:hypothetical protein